MSLLPIRLWPDPVLAGVAVPVTDIPAAAALARDMLETMYAAPGRGLAAPQVGVGLRVFVMDVGWKDGTPEPLVCINPEIVARSARLATGAEGCLSIPGVVADVARAEWIVLRWTDETGAAQEARLEGFAAICAQHEQDHLDGIVSFDRVSPEVRAALEAEYAS